MNDVRQAYCETEGLHCENCGRVDPHADSYSTCCNELTVWADQCRNFHNEG